MVVDAVKLSSPWPVRRKPRMARNRTGTFGATAIRKQAITRPSPTARLNRRNGVRSINRPKNGRLSALVTVAAA
jgi:hypothetical protein